MTTIPDTTPEKPEPPYAFSPQHGCDTYRSPIFFTQLLKNSLTETASIWNMLHPWATQAERRNLLNEIAIRIGVDLPKETNSELSCSPHR